MNKLNSNELNKLDSWDEVPMIDNLLQYRKQLLIGALVVAALILGIYKYTSTRNQEAAVDYLNADRLFSSFIDNSIDAESNQRDLKQLEQILARYPNLHAKYDGQIAQTLINRSQIDEALPFATLAIARTNAENKPYYSDYSATTLVIGEKKYAEALQQALALQKEIASPRADETHVGDTLLAFNLLRIAMLQQQLGLKSEERATWLDLQQRAGNSKRFAGQLEHFHEGKVSLADYIAARAGALK